MLLDKIRGSFPHQREIYFCCVYLQIIQQRTAECHITQRHVWVTAVQKTLDLSADVQSNRLSPLHLLGRERRPCVVVLLQTLLNSSHNLKSVLILPTLF